MSDSGYMSEAAIRLLDLLKSTDEQPISTATIEWHRAEAKEAFLPRAERAQMRENVRVTPIEVAGHPCLDVRPDGSWSGTVLYCFGGGFITGSAREDLIVSAALSAQAGVRVVSVEYPLAPEHPWPAAVQAVSEVYAALSESETSLAVAGESAGGNLALMTLQHERRPDALLLFSPWCDLTHGGDSLRSNDGRDPTLSFEFIRSAAALYSASQDAVRPEISPINVDFPSDGPPVMITTGTRDLLFSQCAELARRMREAGMDVRLDVYDGLWHVFEFYDELPEAAASLSACAAFLRHHLKA